MVVVRYEAPAAGEQGLDFEALLLATLRSAYAVGVEDAAVVDTKIGVINRSVLEGLGAECSAFEKAAAAHVLAANGSVHPRIGLQVTATTENEALERALADVGNEETGLADLVAGGGGGVREPNERNAEKTKIGVDQRDGFIEPDPRVGCVELPIGVLGIAYGDPAAVDKVDVSREALHVPCFEVKRILRNQNCQIGAPLDLDIAANVVKEAVAGADVVMSFIGFEVLVAVVQLDVAGRGGFVRLAVVFDVVGAKSGVPEVNVHLAFSRGDVAFAALRFRFQICDSAFGGGSGSLLGGGAAWRQNCKREEQPSREKKRAERGIIPCMGMAVHA